MNERVAEKVGNDFRVEFNLKNDFISLFIIAHDDGKATTKRRQNYFRH